MPRPLGVASTGAGSDSANARTQPASSPVHSRPVTITGRVALSAPASASRLALAGAGSAAGRHAVAIGRLASPATAAAQATWTGPRGSVSARLAAWAIQ